MDIYFFGVEAISKLSYVILYKARSTVLDIVIFGLTLY